MNATTEPKTLTPAQIGRLALLRSIREDVLAASLRAEEAGIDTEFLDAALWELLAEIQRIRTAAWELETMGGAAR